MKSIKTVRLLAVFLAMLTLLAVCSACAKTDSELWNNAVYLENKTFGEGQKSFELEVIADDYSVTFTVKTDAEFLGTALLEHELIAGDNGAYGLYITSVNGIVADYNANQSWWSISKDGVMLMTGVDSTPIENGAHYELTYKIG